MGVSLTEKAANEVKKIITEQSLPEGTVLRVGVQGGGCSGFSYSLGFDTSTSERDRVVELHGIRMVVDKKFDPYLDGTVVDYYDGLEKRGFVFNNPERGQELRLRQLVPGLIGEWSVVRWAGRRRPSPRSGDPAACGSTRVAVAPSMIRNVYNGQRTTADGPQITTASHRAIRS